MQPSLLVVVGSGCLCLYLECRRLAAVSGRAPSPQFGAWVTSGRMSGTLVLADCIDTWHTAVSALILLSTM